MWLIEIAGKVLESAKEAAIETTVATVMFPVKCLDAAEEAVDRVYEAIVEDRD